MNHTLLLNLAILTAMIIGVIATSNPLFALLILTLQELPCGLIQAKMQLDAGKNGDEDDDEPCMGFTADVK